MPIALPASFNKQKYLHTLPDVLSWGRGGGVKSLLPFCWESLFTRSRFWLPLWSTLTTLCLASLNQQCHPECPSDPMLLLQAFDGFLQITTWTPSLFFKSVQCHLLSETLPYYPIENKAFLMLLYFSSQNWFLLDILLDIFLNLPLPTTCKYHKSRFSFWYIVSVQYLLNEWMDICYEMRNARY